MSIIDAAHASTRHTFEMREDDATLIHDVVRSDIAAHKNWIASAVESGDHDYAKKLVANMRRLEHIAAAFNMQSKRATARISPTRYEMRTTHTL